MIIRVGAVCINIKIFLSYCLSLFFPITLIPNDFRENGDIKFLTKGDNNSVDDRGLYKQGQHWLEKKDVVGRARG